MDDTYDQHLRTDAGGKSVSDGLLREFSGLAKKLIKFEQKSEYYLEKGLECAEKGDWLKALSLFFKAQKQDEDSIELLFNIAHAYAQMGLYEFSNGTLFEILLAEPYNSDAGLFVAANFNALGDALREIYYLGRYSDPDASGEIAQWLEEKASPAFELVHPMTDREREFNKRRADHFLERGMTGDAREILEEILEYFPKDVQAKNNLAKSYLVDEKIQEATAWAQSALTDNSNDIFALCNLSIAYFLSGQEDAADRIAERLSFIKTDNLEEIRRLVKFFCFLERHGDIAYWAEKCLAQTPYDIDHLIFLGAAYYNVCKYEQAKDVFLTLDKLHVSPIIVKHRLDLAQSAIDGGTHTKMSYEFDLPETLEKAYLKKLKTMDFAENTDEFSDNLISWGLRFADMELAAVLLDKLVAADGKSWEFNFERMLISELTPKVKSQVLARLFRGKRRNLFVVKDDYFTEVVWPGKIPPQNVKSGFLLAVAVLNCFMMEADDIILKMYGAACELSSRLISQNYVIEGGKENLLAAVIVRNAQRDMCGDDTLCELFDVDYNVLSFFTEQFYCDD